MSHIWVRLCALIFDFTCFWFASFPWKRLICGIPFLLVLNFLIASYFLIEGRDYGLRNRLLQAQLASALATDDWETARVVLHRKLRIAPEDRDSQFQLARALYATDERDKAVHLMRQLTFGDPNTEFNIAADDSAEVTSNSPDLVREQDRFSDADPRAAQWMLENVYLPRNWEKLSNRDKQDLLSLLKWLHESMPDQVPMKQLYADHLLKAERYHEALPVLVTLIPEEPGIAFRAALIARMLGEETRASEYAELSLAHFTALVQQEPSDASLAVALARCQVFLEQYAEAVQALQAAIERSPQERPRRMLRQVLAGALLAWATALESKPEQTSDERLQTLKNLQLALQYAPDDEHVIQVVANQILATANGDSPQVASLRESLIHGTSPGISHFIRGTSAVIKGDDEKGKFHLEIAAQTLPNSDVILNNLAYVMAQQENADLGQALQISETAISRASPPTPYHLETRGQILFKMGRFADAIPDLEAGLSVPALETGAHHSLAECYRHLGAGDLSEQHRIAAEKGEAVPAVSQPAVE